MPGKASKTLPLPERVAAEFANAEQLASAQTTEVLLYALAIGKTVNAKDLFAAPKRQKESPSGPQNHALPLKPTIAQIAAKAPTSGTAATSSSPPGHKATTRTAPLPKQAGPKLPRFTLRLPPTSPLLHADTTVVARAVRETAPDLSDAVKGVYRAGDGFVIAAATEKDAASIAKHTDAIRAKVSGTLTPIVDQVGYVVKRVPRVLFDGVVGTAPTTLEMVKAIARDQTGVVPTKVTWSKHEGEFAPSRTAVIFFDKEVTNFRIASSAPSRKYVRNPRIYQCAACFGFHRTSSCRQQERCAKCGASAHQGVCVGPTRCLNCLGDHPATSSTCPLRPRAFKGQVLFPSEETVLATKQDNRKRAKDASKADAAAKAAAEAAGSSPASTSANTGATAPGPAPTQPVSSQNSFAVLGDFDVDMAENPNASRNARLTKSHPAYLTFAPSQDWSETRPRVLTYVRRASALRPVQNDMGPSFDILSLTLHCSPEIEIVNVYRPPSGLMPESLNVLLNRPVKANSLFAGDFNLHHEAWEPNVSRSSGASLFVEWLETNSLRLALPYGQPTHNRGHVLDLVLTNIPGATAMILPDAHTTSDHESIRCDIQLSPHSRRPTLAFPKLKDGDGVLLEAALARAEPPSLDGVDAARLDAAAAAGVEAMVVALHHICSPVPAGVPRKDWWNDACKEARKNFLAAQRLEDCQAVIQAGRELKRTARKAKRALDRSRIEKTSHVTEAHRLIGWRKYGSRFAPPPLIWEGRAHCTPAERAEVLFRAKLARPIGGPDVPFESTATAPRRSIPLTMLASEQEVRANMIEVGSTSPGHDRLSVSVLKHVWNVVPWRRWIVCLTNLCLSLGHHPLVFRKAEVIVIPKPNKDDLTDPKNWRPISLLPTLGKGIERLVARRLAFWALKSRVTAPEHFGALPGRAATDLVECLVHDVKDAWAMKNVCTLATVDVEGAFDSVQPGRLAVRMREQGWPDPLVRWAATFASGRFARFRLDDHLTEFRSIPHGLPQGSPASPILFLLYLEPLLNVIPASFGYVDGIAFLCSAKTLEESARLAAERVSQARQWCRDNGLTLADNKTEFQHFHRTQQRPPPIEIDGASHAANDSTRWLGMFLDTKLSFKTHVQHWAAKATKVAAHTRRFGNTVRGCPTNLLRSAALAAALPVLLYGAEVWWRGDTITRAGRTVSTRSAHLVELVERALKATAKSILPVYRTTPVPALLREAGLKPAKLLLEELRARSAIRLAAADIRHPCARRMASAGPRNGSSDLRAKSALTPPIPRRVLLPYSYAPPPPRLMRSEMSKEAFEKLVAAIPPYDIVVYSDGSKQADGSAGAGAHVTQLGQVLAEKTASLGRYHEVYDAEVAGALLGLKAALASPCTRLATDVHVILDNQKASESLLDSTPTLTSQREILEFRELAASWSARTVSTIARPGRVRVLWCPGHVGIEGNERADVLAKAACRETPARLVATVAGAKAATRRHFFEEASKWWQKTAPASYHELEIPWPRGPPKELRLPRRHLGFLIQCRTDHGDFMSYHEWFEHTGATLYCACGRPKASTHFAACPTVRERLATLGRPVASVP
ncbi:uncharacterized protein BROUX77_004347 [Berkeleyomyces rouxiae]|uniref:uncharacterized protein n=1 Tax=Berkeleyomyces rouxiae TaxID=2035830 RepID=UPI003B7C6B1C